MNPNNLVSDQVWSAVSPIRFQCARPLYDAGCDGISATLYKEFHSGRGQKSWDLFEIPTGESVGGQKINLTSHRFIFSISGVLLLVTIMIDDCQSRSINGRLSNKTDPSIVDLRLKSLLVNYGDSMRSIKIRSWSTTWRIYSWQIPLLFNALWDKMCLQSG